MNSNTLAPPQSTIGLFSRGIGENDNATINVSVLGPWDFGVADIHSGWRAEDLIVHTLIDNLTGTGFVRVNNTTTGIITDDFISYTNTAE